MIGTSLVFDIFVLLAARAGGGGGGNNSGRPKTRGDNHSQKDFESASDRKRGRQRYAPATNTDTNTNTNRKSTPQGNRHKSGRQGSNRNGSGNDQRQEDVLPPVPPLTNPIGPFPTYFTCRHTYEDTLIDEITRYGAPSVQASSPYPGLVRVEGLSSESISDPSLDKHMRDPVYALQCLPNCRIIECQNSIKGLARATAEVEGFSKLLAKAPRGSLSIHALVPGMCKGQTSPILQRRSYLVAEAIQNLWKGQFPAARKPKLVDQKKDDNNSSSGNISIHQNDARLLLQVMLLSPDAAAVSLAACHQPMGSSSQGIASNALLWPNPNYPIGMARVDIRNHKMPSSAYRKLLEAFGCFGLKPSDQDTVVDLGASPGGWTAALLLYCDGSLEGDGDDATPNTPSSSRSDYGLGIHIYAVDRSPLDRGLMNDPRVTFVQGDAFTFEPEQPVTWMVSDIIAYPDRIVELIDLWCSKELASNMIVTMKFQGSEPSWEHLDQAIQVAESYQYKARAKHFFNNKNEVTVMLSRREEGSVGRQRSSTISPFYKIV